MDRALDVNLFVDTLNLMNHPECDIRHHNKFRDEVIGAYRAVQEENATLKDKVRTLTAWYDKQNGTPCEQIRHQQEVEALKAERDEWHGKFTAKFLDFNKQGVELDAVKKDLAQARQDLKDAAGELMVDMPEPGTVMAKVIIANVLMRKQRDEAKQREADLLKQKELEVAKHLESGALDGCQCDVCLAVVRVVKLALNEEQPS